MPRKTAKSASRNPLITAPRRHRHGQPVGLGNHAPRGGSPYRIRRAVRGERSSPPTARHRRLYAYAVRRPARAAGRDRGAGGAAHLPGMTGRAYHPAGSWRAGEKQIARWARQSSCRLRRCRPAFRSALWRLVKRAPPMPACWRFRFWRCRIKSSRKNCAPGASAQTASIVRTAAKIAHKAR